MKYHRIHGSVIESCDRERSVYVNSCSKSTIIRLLYRFYEPKEGRVLVGGVPVNDITLNSLRKQIAIVPQDCVLFNSTIYHNVAYGNLNATREEVENAADMAGLTSAINVMPRGWDTEVGERGLKLSGGQVAWRGDEFGEGEGKGKGLFVLVE